MTGICVRNAPCLTCPYRRDVPSGIWDKAEYAKLPDYDGEIADQLEAGATGLFYCHTSANFLCAGWAGCHDLANNLALRLNERAVDPSIYYYAAPVPLFTSGAEAAAHGMRDYDQPGPEATKVIHKILARQDKGASK